jgi:hypothetical protein
MGLAELIGSRTTLAVAALGCAELAAARGDRRASLVYAERALDDRARDEPPPLSAAPRAHRPPADSAARVEEGG